MRSLIIVALVLPTVFGGVVFDSKSDNTFLEDLTAEELDEIQQLKALTQALEESGEPFMIPSLSSKALTQDDVSFYMVNRNNTDFQQFILEESQNITTSNSSFNTELDTIILIHGWHSTYNSSTFPTNVMRAYLEVKDVNIVSVNWDNIAAGLYGVAQSSVPAVGAYVGQFIQNISTSYNYSLDRISFVGHSLGAHISGFAGKSVNGSIASITGLDPAGPLYYEILPEQRLSKTDAQYVQVIHTCGSLLGVAFNVAHADYWPNGGLTQPGCLPEVVGCSHGRAHGYFAESLSPNSSYFLALSCSSSVLYNAGLCAKHAVVRMGGPDTNATITGTYYLSTNSSSPFALGSKGI